MPNTTGQKPAIQQIENLRYSESREPDALVWRDTGQWIIMPRAPGSDSPAVAHVLVPESLSARGLDEPEKRTHRDAGGHY